MQWYLSNLNNVPFFRPKNVMLWKKIWIAKCNLDMTFLQWKWRKKSAKSCCFQLRIQGIYEICTSKFDRPKPKIWPEFSKNLKNSDLNCRLIFYQFLQRNNMYSHVVFMRGILWANPSNCISWTLCPYFFKNSDQHSTRLCIIIISKYLHYVANV